MLCLNEVIEYKKLPAKVICFNHEERRTPAHWHTNLEVKYLAEGSNDIFTDGRRYRLEAGDIAVINRGMVHYSKQVSACNIKGITIVFSNEYFQSFCPEEQERLFEPILSRESVPEAFLILQRIYEIYSESRRDNFSYMKVSGLLDILVYYLMTGCSSGNKKKKNGEGVRCRERYVRIADYIEKNYRKPLNLNEMAEQCGLTREHFSRSFKQYMGVNFTKFVNDIRVSEGRRNLIHTDQTVLEIALDCGFADIRSFAKCFREEYGLSPAQYRRLHGRDSGTTT